MSNHDTNRALNLGIMSERHKAAGHLDFYAAGVYFINGQLFDCNRAQAERYLESIGFSEREGRDYLDALSREADL